MTEVQMRYALTLLGMVAFAGCAHFRAPETSFPPGPGLLDKRPLARPDSYRLVGWVVADNTGKPLADARVNVEGTSVWAETDQYGRYFLANVPFGHDVLLVMRIGYFHERRTLNRKRLLEGVMAPATVSFTDTLNFWLHPQTLPTKAPAGMNE